MTEKESDDSINVAPANWYNPVTYISYAKKYSQFNNSSSTSSSTSSSSSSTSTTSTSTKASTPDSIARDIQRIKENANQLTQQRSSSPTSSTTTSSTTSTSTTSSSSSDDWYSEYQKSIDNPYTKAYSEKLQQALNEGLSYTDAYKEATSYANKLAEDAAKIRKESGGTYEESYTQAYQTQKAKEEEAIKKVEETIELPKDLTPEEKIAKYEYETIYAREKAIGKSDEEAKRYAEQTQQYIAQKYSNVNEYLNATDYEIGSRVFRAVLAREERKRNITNEVGEIKSLETAASLARQAEMKYTQNLVLNKNITPELEPYAKIYLRELKQNVYSGSSLKEAKEAAYKKANEQYIKDQPIQQTVIPQVNAQKVEEALIKQGYLATPIVQEYNEQDVFNEAKKWVQKNQLNITDESLKLYAKAVSKGQISPNITPIEYLSEERAKEADKHGIGFGLGIADSITGYFYSIPKGLGSLFGFDTTKSLPLPKQQKETLDVITYSTPFGIPEVTKGNKIAEIATSFIPRPDIQAKKSKGLDYYGGSAFGLVGATVLDIIAPIPKVNLPFKTVKTTISEIGSKVDVVKPSKVLDFVNAFGPSKSIQEVAKQGQKRFEKMTKNDTANAPENIIFHDITEIKVEPKPAKSDIFETKRNEAKKVVKQLTDSELEQEAIRVLRKFYPDGKIPIEVIEKYKREQPENIIDITYNIGLGISNKREVNFITPSKSNVELNIPTAEEIRPLLEQVEKPQKPKTQDDRIREMIAKTMKKFNVEDKRLEDEIFKLHKEYTIQNPEYIQNIELVRSEDALRNLAKEYRILYNLEELTVGRNLKQRQAIFPLPKLIIPEENQPYIKAYQDAIRELRKFYKDQEIPDIVINAYMNLNIKPKQITEITIDKYPGVLNIYEVKFWEKLINRPTTTTKTDLETIARLNQRKPKSKRDDLFGSMKPYETKGKGSSLVLLQKQETENLTKQLTKQEKELKKQERELLRLAEQKQKRKGKTNYITEYEVLSTPKGFGIPLKTRNQLTEYRKEDKLLLKQFGFPTEKGSTAFIIKQKPKNFPKDVNQFITFNIFDTNELFKFDNKPGRSGKFDFDNKQDQGWKFDFGMPNPKKPYPDFPFSFKPRVKPPPFVPNTPPDIPSQLKATFPNLFNEPPKRTQRKVRTTKSKIKNVRNPTEYII